MRPELETYRQIDLYLKGELQGDELVEFTDRIASENVLAEEIELQRATNLVVKGAAFASLRERMSSDIKKIDKKRQVFQRSLWAATLLLFTAGGIAVFYLTQTADSKTETPTLIEQKEIIPATPQKEAPLFVDEEKKETHKVKSINKKATELTKSVRPEQAYISDNTPSANSNVEKEININHTSPTHTAPKVEETSNAEENVSIPVKPIDPCSGIKIMANPVVQATCNGEANGKILYHQSDIHGGNSPYQISIDPKNNKNKEAYYNLSAGEHVFQIRDSKGCEQSLTISVPEKICKNNKFIIHPDQNETWKSPVENQAYILSIHTKRGEIVLKQNVSEGSVFEWAGTDLHGMHLESGMYLYVIEYHDGRKENGQITISR